MTRAAFVPFVTDLIMPSRRFTVGERKICGITGCTEEFMVGSTVGWRCLDWFWYLFSPQMMQCVQPNICTLVSSAVHSDAMLQFQVMLPYLFFFFFFYSSTTTTLFSFSLFLTILTWNLTVHLLTEACRVFDGAFRVFLLSTFLALYGRMLGFVETNAGW